MHSEIDHPEFPSGVAIIGSDDQAGTYSMLYFDERGISRIQEVAVAENQIKWWRNDPHFSQRYVMNIDGDTIVSHGEMSRDGGDWEADLSLTYKRV